MNSMRNLEKLGILVIVILVVVVGVVAITPGEQLDRALDLVPVDHVAERDRVPEIVPQGQDPIRSGNNSSSANPSPADPYQGGVDKLPKWPGDIVDPGVDPNSVQEPKTKPGPVLSRPATYTVKKGDSYYSIAKRRLKDASLMHALMRANPSISAKDLDIGDVLILPGMTVPRDGSSNSLERSAKKAPTAREAREARRPAPVGPGGFYVVRNRDTLVGIAKRELGSSLRWQEIARLNKDVLNGTTRIVEGMRLRLPGARPGGASGLLVNRNAVASSSGRSYTVRKNDTLSSIARKQLGKPGRWQEIAKLNRALLKGSHVIRTGIELQLPPK